MIPPERPERRQFLATAASAGGLLLAGCARSAEAGGPARGGEKEGERGGAEVTPGEDLMQEHGLLERILLVYEEAAGRIARSESIELAVVSTGAGLVRRFVEEYHERLEERFVFPALEAGRRQVELVAVLRAQHQAGRRLTDEIARLAASATTPALEKALRDFVRMYRPHAAREETVLLPAFREIVGRGAYRELGEKFEAEEHARFGEGGFEAAVAEVARLEQTLGIDDLSRFTPGG